jgi:hypothetical protein
MHSPCQEPRGDEYCLATASGPAVYVKNGGDPPEGRAAKRVASCKLATDRRCKLHDQQRTTRFYHRVGSAHNFGCPGEVAIDSRN